MAPQFSPRLRALALLAVLSCGGIAALLFAPRSEGVGGSWGSNGISESSSGALFRAVRSRKYRGRRRFASWVPPPPPLTEPARTGRACRNWAVVTSIFPPTKTVHQIAALPKWCIVIAGDLKSPAEYNVSGSAVFLSAADQRAMTFETGRLLRWNHFGRKNLGFLYALQHGARWVYDVDDDNELQPQFERGGVPLPRPGAFVDEVNSSHKLYNLYAQMSSEPTSWPRGFPLEAIKDGRTKGEAFVRRVWPARRVGVVQSLADHDPDVDGIYRLTRPLPFTFAAAPRSAPKRAPRGPPKGAAQRLRPRLEPAAPLADTPRRLAAEGTRSVAGVAASTPSAAVRAAVRAAAPAGPDPPVRLVSLREGTMMPYNAQATLHAYGALWALLLPCSVHGRVTDIWRAYFSQRLMWDVGLRVAFSTPWVTQYRNPHNYLADFNSETPLYQQSGALVDALLAWRPTAPSLPGRIEELYIAMYEMGILGLADVALAQAWLSDLQRVGYRFPSLVVGHREQA